MLGVPKFNDLELKFSWSICIVVKAYKYQRKSENILFYVFHMSANNTPVACNF